MNVTEEFQRAKARVSAGEDAHVVIEPLLSQMAAQATPEQRLAFKKSTDALNAHWAAKQTHINIPATWAPLLEAVDAQIAAAQRLEQAFSSEARDDLLAARDATVKAAAALKVPLPVELAVSIHDLRQLTAALVSGDAPTLSKRHEAGAAHIRRARDEAEQKALAAIEAAREAMEAADAASAALWRK